MSISAAEASRLTGKSKQAIINAINSGKISAIKDLDGAWQIEPVELFRYYQPVSSLNGNGHQELDSVSPQLDGTLQSLDSPSIETLQVEVKMLREVLDAKDALVAAKDDTIADLRARLNVEQEERRRLSMMLAAPAAPSQLATSQPQRKGWWVRLLGGA